MKIIFFLLLATVELFAGQSGIFTDNVISNASIPAQPVNGPVRLEIVIHDWTLPVGVMHLLSSSGGAALGILEHVGATGTWF